MIRRTQFTPHTTTIPAAEPMPELRTVPIERSTSAAYASRPTHDYGYGKSRPSLRPVVA